MSRRRAAARVPPLAGAEPRPVATARGSVFGSEAGLRAAYSSYGAELLGAATRALGDRHAAEEAVQETFLRVWRFAD